MNRYHPVRGLFTAFWSVPRLPGSTNPLWADVLPATLCIQSLWLIATHPSIDGTYRVHYISGDSKRQLRSSTEVCRLAIHLPMPRFAELQAQLDNEQCRVSGPSQPLRVFPGLSIL